MTFTIHPRLEIANIKFRLAKARISRRVRKEDIELNSTLTHRFKGHSSELIFRSSYLIVYDL